MSIPENAIAAAGRRKVAFLPLNTNHVMIFSNIVRHMSADCEIWCNDRIAESATYHTEDAIKRYKMPYRHFPSKVNRSGDEGFLQKLVTYFSLRHAVREMLDHNKPALLVMGLDNDPISRICIGLCKARDVRTVLIPEGLIKPYEFKEGKKHLSSYGYGMLGLLGLYLKYETYAKGGCDFIFVSGRRSQRILEEVGVDSRRMMIVGQQKFDPLLQKTNAQNTETTGTRTVLHAASTRICRDKSEIELVREAYRVARSAGYGLIIKMHPRDPNSAEDLMGLVGESGGDIRVIKGGYDALDMIGNVTIVLTISSAIILEAMIMDKECVVANYLAGRRRFEYDEYEALHVISDKGQIAERISDAIQRPKPRSNKRKLLEDEIGPLDGNAGKRTASLLGSIVTNRYRDVPELKSCLSGVEK